jgi:thiol-disulfide isomerase/thioredoxin
LPIAIKALISFGVPFAAGLPIVVGQYADYGEQIYLRHWDYYRTILFSRGPDWIVIGIHCFLTALFAVALFLTTRRLESHRPEAAHRGRAFAISSFVIVIFLACANLFVARQYLLAMAPGRPDYSRTHELASGTSIPKFELIDTDGVEIRHEPLTDRVFLVNFFAPWCGPCCREMPHLQEIWEQNRDDPRFSMVVIGVREPNDALVGFKNNNGYTMPFAADKDGFVYSLFGLDGAIPHTCLLQNGAIRLSIAGYHENRLYELKQHVEATLKQSATR